MGGVVAGCEALTFGAGEPVELDPVLHPEDELEFPELGRLEAARVRKEVAEAREFGRRHRLEHVDLAHECLEDLQHPLEVVARRVDLVGVE